MSKFADALAAGYSKQEIVAFLRDRPGYDARINEALSSGYSEDEIVDHLHRQEFKAINPSATDEDLNYLVNDSIKTARKPRQTEADNIEERVQNRMKAGSSRAGAEQATFFDLNLEEKLRQRRNGLDASVRGDIGALGMKENQNWRDANQKLRQDAGRERTWGEAAQDVGAQLLEGGQNISGAVPDLVAPDSEWAQFHKKAADFWRSKQSEPLKARAQLAGQAIDRAGEDGVIAQVVEAASQYWDDPVLASRFVVTNLPSMVPGIAAAKLAQAGALARGATAARAMTAGVVAAGGVNAGLNAGGARGEAFEDIKQTLIKQGMDERQANEIAKRESIVPAMVGGATGAFSGSTGLERAFAGGIGRPLASGLVELAGEQAEEVLPKVTTNLVAGRYDDRSPGQDVGRTMVETAIGSAPGAALASGMEAFGKEPQGGTPKKPVAEGPNDDNVSGQYVDDAVPVGGKTPGIATQGMPPSAGTTERPLAQLSEFEQFVQSEREDIARRRIGMVERQAASQQAEIEQRIPSEVETKDAQVLAARQRTDQEQRLADLERAMRSPNPMATFAELRTSKNQPVLPEDSAILKRRMGQAEAFQGDYAPGVEPSLPDGGMSDMVPERKPVAQSAPAGGNFAAIDNALANGFKVQGKALVHPKTGKKINLNVAERDYLAGLKRGGNQPVTSPGAEDGDADQGGKISEVVAQGVEGASAELPGSGRATQAGVSGGLPGDGGRAAVPGGSDGSPVPAGTAGAQGVNEFDVSTRTDAQLDVLVKAGKPGWREAAIAEVARRKGEQNGLQEQATETAPTPKDDTRAKLKAEVEKARKTDGTKKTRLTPMEDSRVQAMADDLRNLSKQTGWQQEGGRLLRKSEDYNSPDYNEIVGRTKWIPHAEWYGGMATKLRGKEATAAVEKAIAGQPMTAKEKRFVAELADIAQEQAGERQADKQAMGEADAEAMAEREAIMAEAELAGLETTDEGLDRILDAAFSDTPGAFTDDEIFGALNEGQEVPGPAETVEPQGPYEGSGQRGEEAGQDAGQAFSLTGQTPEEVRAEEQARADREKAEKEAADKAESEAKAKRIAKEVESRKRASSDNFQLGQSAEDALAGQGDIFGGLTQQEVSQEAEAIEQLRDKLRKIEDKILLAAGERDNIEQAMSSRKVDKSLKDKRNTIRDQVRAAQKRLDDAQKQPAISRETPAGQRKATLEERIASEKASHVLDLNKAQTGWKRIDGANNEAVTLVSYDGKIAVPFLTKDKKSGTASVRMNAEAHAYAIDNPYRAAPIPEGELIAKPLYAEAEAPAGQPAAATRSRPKSRITFQGGITGPTGAKLTGYEWSWKPYSYVDNQGEDREGRESDWDNAETNVETGRDIVHKFTVTHDGKEQTVSLESALQLLGFADAGSMAIKGLANTAKRVAKLKMSIAEMEPVANAYDKAKAAVDAMPYPEIVDDGSGWRRMGSAKVRWDSKSDDNERLRVLRDAWRSDQMHLMGFKSYERTPHEVISDLQEKLNRAERKMAESAKVAAATAQPAHSKPESAGEEGKKAGVVVPHTLAVHDDLFDRIKTGNVTADEFKAAFDALLNNEDALRDELGKMTKPQLLSRGLPYWAKNETKAKVVDAAYRAMQDDFVLGNSIQWSMGEKYDDVIRRYVDKTTDDDIKKYADRNKAAIEAREERAAQVAEAVKDPKTLDDFTQYIRAKRADGMTFNAARMTLNPEQRAAFDSLWGESTRDERKARADQQKTDIRVAAKTTDGQVIETRHTKTGEPLFVVKAAERVERDVYSQWNATAKRLGGWYSSFRGNGAVPGFQFKTRDNADAFLAYLGGNVDQAKEVAKERRDAFSDDKSQSAVERLTEMADRLEERADESLVRERKANTDRRARMAASAESAANADKAMAKTMRNIAGAISSGKARFLDRVRQKAQVEMLQGFVRSAQYDEHRAKYPTYMEQEKHRGEAPTIETADYATFPAYTAYRSDLAKLGRQLSENDGTKRLGDALLKVADDVTDAYLAFAKENLQKVSTFRVNDGRDAMFASKATAEEAIKRSGFKGKAVVLPFKRGQNLIIMSPSAAKEAGIWQGDDDKRITLTSEFGAEIVEKTKGSRSIETPWQFQSAYDNLKRLSALGIETPAEFRAALREFIGLKEEAAKPDKVKEMERAMIGRRNDGLDFFPTPASVAQQMVETADIKEGMAVLEPSAGMGHIAEQIREAGVDPDVVEMSNDRRELLDAKGFNVVGRDFMDASGAYDRIIMNPPFSDRRDIEHVRHAYDLLKPGGRLVAIMGEGSFFGSDKKATEFRDWLDGLGGTSEKLEEGTFMDPSLPVNTGVNARMVVIDKPEGDTRLSRSLSFISPLTKAIESAKQESMPAAQWALWLDANKAKLGLKEDELYFSGIRDYLTLLGKDKVTKAEIADYLSGNGVRVEGVVKGGQQTRDGDTKFSGYWDSSYKGGIPGTYREILVTMPRRDDAAYEKLKDEIDAEYRRNGNSEKYSQLLAKQREMRDARKSDFRSSHWDEPNVLVHVRLDEVTGADGKRYVRVGEVQSDFGQAFKKQKDAIKKYVDTDFQGIVDRMKAAGALTVEC